MITARPAPNEHAPYYGKYVALVTENDILDVLEQQRKNAAALWRSVPESQAGVLHAPYTWTIRQVAGHLIDGERVFGYRALRFARGDSTALPGFDENIYARSGEFDRLPLADLADEFDGVRHSTLHLFRHLPQEAWTRTGEANGATVSVRALAFIIAGHTRHHMAIVRKRLDSALAVR